MNIFHASMSFYSVFFFYYFLSAGGFIRATCRSGVFRSIDENSKNPNSKVDEMEIEEEEQLEEENNRDGEKGTSKNLNIREMITNFISEGSTHLNSND